MTFVGWRLATSALGVLLGALFVATGFVFEGVIAASVASLWFLAHAGVPESVGVRFLHHQAYLQFARLAILVVLTLAALAALAVGFVLRWNTDPEGPLLFASLAGCAVLLMREVERASLSFDRLMDGGNAEVLVYNELHTLPDGWVSDHNWLRPDGFGNVDHIVRSPEGDWFAIETKSHRFRYRDLRQAVTGALEVRKALGLRWVTPVLCVNDREQQTVQRRVGNAVVWVVDREALAPFLREFRPSR